MSFVFLLWPRHAGQLEDFSFIHLFNLRTCVCVCARARARVTCLGTTLLRTYLPVIDCARSSVNKNGITVFVNSWIVVADISVFVA